jgi:hypothetical protein
MKEGDMGIEDELKKRDDSFPKGVGIRKKKRCWLAGSGQVPGHDGGYRCDPL